MSVRFNGAELRPVLIEAVNNRCPVTLVKDSGVYLMSERGKYRSDGRQELIAYAIGCNPDVDDFDTWYWRGINEFGGDDFAEFLDPTDSVFTRILHSDDDLEISATETELTLTAVSPL